MVLHFISMPLNGACLQYTWPSIYFKFVLCWWKVSGNFGGQGDKRTVKLELTIDGLLKHSEIELEGD